MSYPRNLKEVRKEARDTWKPYKICKDCCAVWLVDGPLRCSDSYRIKGCGGGCGGHHPSIKLQFDAATNTTKASLSHALDPFVACFQRLVREGKAVRISNTEYRLHDYIRPVETAIRSHGGFGNHLVVVAGRYKRLSDRAQLKEVERREKGMLEKYHNASGKADGDVGELFEKVAHVALLQPVLRNDLLTLDCLSKSCKVFQEEIAPIAARRIETLKLSVQPLVDGRRQYQYLDPRRVHDDEKVLSVSGHSVKYSKRGIIELEFRRGGTDEAWYYPTTTDTSTFSWDSGILLDVAEDFDRSRRLSHTAEYACVGNLLRVFWHPDETDVDYVTEGAEGDAGILMAQFQMPSHQDLGLVTVSNRGVMIEYDVLASTCLVSGTCHHKGTMKFTRAKVDFKSLLREHARRASHDISDVHKNILGTRPLLTREKEYNDWLHSLVGEYV